MKSNRRKIISESNYSHPKEDNIEGGNEISESVKAWQPNLFFSVEKEPPMNSEQKPESIKSKDTSCSFCKPGYNFNDFIKMVLIPPNDTEHVVENPNGYLCN
jgi:hypothetical protein